MPLNMGNFSLLWCTGRKTNIETLIKTTDYAQKGLLTHGEFLQSGALVEELTLKHTDKNYCLCSEMPLN
jgi:hypothetical protein